MKQCILAISLILFGFAACTEDIPERETSPVTPENCKGIYFPTNNQATVELEPTEPTEITITIARTDSVGDIEVPITVDVNDEDVFVVPEKAAFADKEKVTTFTVTFPTAAEGITYNLKLSVSGSEFVDEYAQASPFLSTNVTRIKWNVVDPFVYVDGTFLTFYGVGQLPMYVETEKAEVGNAVRYRFKNAYRVATPGAWQGDEYIPEADADGIYNGYYYNWPGDVDETKNYYTVIEIDKDGNVSMAPCELGVTWGDGMFSIGSIYGNLSTDIDSYPLGIYEKGEDGDIITFPANSLYVSMENYNNGGKYPCSTPTIIYTTKAAYIAANLKIDDFNGIEYEEIEGVVSEFESAAYSESWSQSFSKAIDIDPDNEESEYKDLFYLANLYADGFGLAFYYNGKSISIPTGQETGRKVYGNDIYISPSDNIESSVQISNKGVTIYTFGLKFHYEDGTVVGEFAETFYYSKDPVSYAITDFQGNYKLTASSQFAGYPDADMDVTIAAGESENTFVITGIDLAEEVKATFDPGTSTLSIAPQELADYETFDITLYTTTPEGDVSTTATMDFNFNMAGNLIMTATSEADGYLLRSDAAGGWVDGYYNLKFTPQSKERALTQKNTVSRQLTSKILKKDSVAKKQKCLKNNFAVQGKTSVKKMLQKGMKPGPVF
ncbi:MAG: hypothetical protein LBP83_04720 [Dysgonamonadaceae bacterium]|jgi:hypothetical protein|nr:hypothetical protein [Dysgonamonadaceae bacterium]